MVQSGRFGGGNSLLGILTTLGLLTNLKLCLDAGDLASYPGSGQTWADTSGSGNDFFLGLLSGADAADPTFNGVAGDLLQTTYWSFDGADSFIEASAGMNFASTWSAAADQHSGLFVFWPAALIGSTIGMFEADGTDRFQINLSASETLNLVHSGVFGGAGKFSSNAYTAAAWNFAGFSVDEDAGVNGSFLQLGSTVTTFGGANLGGGTNSGAGPYQIADGSGVGAFPVSWRLGMVAIFNAALTTAQMQQVYDAINLNRFPLAA